MNILYTAMCGNYDAPKPIKPPNEGWRYLFFTDDPNLQVDGWEMVRLPESNLSPKMKAKEPKIKPYEFLPKHDFSVWVDASLEVFGNPNNILTPYKDKDIGICIHPSGRRTMYEEADTVAKYGLDTPENVDAVVKRYKEEGFCGSYRSCIYQADVIVRKNNRKTNAFNEHWWKEILATSTRDQLSLPYVLSKHNLDLGKMAVLHISMIMRKHAHTREYNNIFFVQPYGFGLKIGDRLNYEIERMPDDAWIVMTDQDVAIVTEKAGDLLNNVINRYDDTDLFGAYTNRVGLGYQRWPEIDMDNMDMSYHHEVAQQKLRQHYSNTEIVDKPIAGFFMMFPKKTWEKYPFQSYLIDQKKVLGDKQGVYFDYDFSYRILKGGGKIRLIKGLYLLHCYRLNKGLRNVTHLTTAI